MIHLLFGNLLGWTLTALAAGLGSAAVAGVVFVLSGNDRASLTRERRRLRGQCPVCEYDVRANPRRCPECGTELRPAV